MKLSCAFVLTLTNLVIVSPFSFSVKGSGTSANAGATAVPATFGLVHNVPSKGNGYSGKPSSPGSIGFTSRSENSSFGAFNYNSGQAHGSSEYIAPGEVGHNVATAVQAVVTAAVHANAESLANIKASGSYSPNKINNFSTNSASHFQYQPTTFESKPSSPFNVGQSTSINSHEHSKHVLITSKQSEKSDKFNQPSEVQSLPCQTFNSGSVIAEKSPVYNRGFGGPSGILTPDNKATYIGSSSFSIQQSTTESVKPLIQSLNNEYNKPLDTGVSVKPELKPTASIKPLNNEKTKKDHFVTSSQHGQVSYIKDKNTLSSLGAKVPSTNEYSNEKVPANNFNGSKPIQNFQLFVQPYYGNVLPSSDNNIQNEKAFVSTNNPEKIKQTKEITYTGGFGAPTGVLKPFSQLQSSSHTFVSSEKLEQYETSKTNKVTTTETKESTVTTSSKKPLNEINVNDTPSTESTTYQLHENDSPADSYVTQKLTSPVYDEYSVTSDSPVLSTSKTHSNFFQLEHKEINEASQQPENNTFNPIVTSSVQDPTPSSSFSKVPVSYTIEKQVYVNSLDTKSAVSNSYDKLKPEKTEILISNQNKPVYTPIAATKLTPVSSWEQSSNNIPIKSNFENTQPSKFSVTPKTFQSKYPLESGYTVAKVKQEISGESYSSELNPSTPVSATVVSTLLSGKPQFNDFLLFTTTKPPTASVNGANQYLVTSSAGFSSTSSEYSESHKISSTSDHTLAVINGQSEKAQKIPNNIINDFTYPTASVASLVNSGPIQSVHQSIPNLAISSTNTGTASVQSTLDTIAQQSSYEPLHEYVAPTASSVSKTSENSNVWSSGNALSIDYSSSTQKSNVPNPSASVGSQGNSNPIQNQNQFKPSLPISSINVGTSPLDSTLVAFAQQSSYKPSQEYAAPTAGSIPKVSEIPKVWSMKNSSSIDYSSSTQKPNNFANPTASVAPQGNSNPIQSQNQFKPSLPISSTNFGTSSLDSTLVAFAQQSSYKPSQEYAAPTAGSIPKVSESPKVWSTENPSSIGYSASTQKPNNFANPTATFASQTNSNSVQSQHKFNPNLSLSSTNVGSAYVQSTLATFAQQSSYDPSHEYVAPTASSVSKTSENSNVWSSGNALSIDYSSSTQKPNNFANPTASVAPQGNSNPIQSQNQFKPSLPISSTNVGTSPLDSTLVAFAQQSSYKPSQEYAAPTAGSIPKVSESPKVWSTENPSSIGYSSSTQKPNNFANPTATFASQTNSNSVQSQHKFNPNLSLSSTNVGSAYVQSTLATFAQQSSYDPSLEYVAPTASSVSKTSENSNVWSSGNALSIDYSSPTQKSNNVPNPFASVGSQGNSNPIQNQNQFKPSLPFSSPNVGTAPLDSALVAFAQQSSYKPSQEYAAPTAGSIPKVSESPKVWSTENPSSIGYSSSTQKPNNFANPTATFASQINSNFVQSQHKFNPNLSLSSTNVGSAYVQSNFAQQSTYEPSIENSSIDSVVPKVSENIEVFPENPSFIDNNSSTQKPNSLTYSGTSSNSYIKEFELQSSTAPTVGNVTPNKPLYSNTFGTLTGAVKPSGYSHSIVNNLPSSISNSNYDLGLVSVSNVKLGQSNYFSQYKPALSGFKEKSTTLSSLYPTDSIYVSTAKPYVTPASSNIAQQSTELNQEISKFSSSLHSATKPTQGSKQQLNNNGVSTVSLLTPSTIKPTSSYSAVFPTSGPVFVAGSSQSKPQYQYSTVQPATQKKQWYTNTFETFGGVKPQSSYTYPGFTSSFSNFGYGSSIVANKQFTRVPLTGQYKQPSTGQYNPISTGLYKPTSTGQYYPTSTGQYNPTLTNQYKPYNWGFSRQPATLKPSGQIAPAGDLISTADAPKSSTSSEKSKFNYGFSILNQKETGFASGFSSPSVSHTTPKPISSIEEYSGNQKITTFISTTPKTNTQKPWFIASQATTHGATNLLETSDSVTSQFFNGEKPTVAPYSVVPSPNPPSNILPSSEKPVEYFYINNSEPVSDIPKHTSQLSYDKKDNNSFEQISSTTPKIVGLIKPTSSVNFVVQTSSSLSAGSENTKNSQLTTSNYISQQTLNQNNIQIDSSLSTTSSGQETNGPKTEFLSNGISSVGYDTSSPKPSSVPFFTNLNFPFTKPSNAPHKSEYTSVSGVSTVVFEPPKKLSESIVPNYSSAVSTENNYSIISDKEEVKDQVTSISGFQHNPLVFSNSFNSVIPSKPSAKPGQNISSKPQDQSILSPKDSLLAENQGKLDINVKPTNLHSSSTIQLSGSIYNSSNQQKPTATVSLPVQSEDTRTVYQKPLSQHSSLFHSGTTQLSKPNIKITVINPPSSSAVYSQYVGSFGGSSGLLKPNDFSGPFVQANVPSQKNLSHQNQPALDINSGIKVAEHSKLGSYSGGFGGPPGVLKPDNSEIHTGVFYAGQDKQSLNVETSGLHGSLTIHNLSPSAPSVGSYADIKKQNVYSPFIPTKPNKAISPNSEGLANSKVESYNQQHSGVVHDSGNTKSTSSFSGQFGKVNSLSTIATVEASAEAGTGPFGLKGAFTSGLASAHSSGPIANTDHGSKIF